MSLRARLLLLVLAVLLPTAGLVVWIIAGTYVRESEAAQQRLRETTRALSLVIDREIDKRGVGVPFTPAVLQTIIREQRLPDSWIAEIVDREHTVVARAPDGQRRLGSKALPALREALRAGPEGFIDSVSHDGVQVAAFFSRSPVHGWTFIIGVPQPTLAAAARRAAWQAGAGAALLAAFAAALAAYAARRIRRPIAMLEEAARQLGRDEVPDPPPTGLAEADAVGAALRRAGMLAAMDLAERQHAIDELRRAEESQRLLVQINDATRGLRDPVQLQYEIVRRVGRHFGVSRCTYGEVDNEGRFVSVQRDHCEGVASIAGRHRLDDFGPAIIEELQAGRTVVISDLAQDARVTTPAMRAAYERIETRAMLGVPLVKEGRFVAVLVLHHRAPRIFTADDATLLEQLAERTWFAVESARAESALRESRDVLALAMRGGRMGAWSRDLATDRVWWSPEMEEIFGLPPGGFGGATDAFRSLVHREDVSRLAAAVDQAIASGEDYAVEFRFRHASGQWRWMEGRGRAVYSADGKPAMLYGLGIDIEARKQAEEELRRLNAELSDAARRKDEFLATLAHELRNPLAPITHALEILRLKDPADAETRWTRDVIERQVRQMTRLVDDLLDVARITRGKIALRRERVALASVVQAAIEAARPFIEAAGHTLQVVLPADAMWLDADPTRVTQVLLNLLNNAAKYTPAGGHIVVAAAVEEGQARVSVRDDGMGIAAGQLEHVFEMFSQVAPALERSHGGLGIGLALARGLVELHGGRIEAHSPGPGLGSEFVLHLPLAPTSAVPLPLAGGTAADGPALRVLVVDDNRDAAESLALMLQLSGHEVATAHGGEAALASVPAFDPDVVLLDIGMPGMNGYEVARRLRQMPEGEERLLVALTGWGQEEDKRRAVDAGFDHHLTKPVDPDHLHSVLQAGHGRRLAAAG